MLSEIRSRLFAPDLAIDRTRVERHRTPRLFYAVNHSLPFSSDGYAIRTHGVACALVSKGVEVIAASRPGAPWDQPGFVDQNFPGSHVVDKVRYLHTPEPREGIGRLDEFLTLSVEVLKEQMRVFKPTAVMAASNWRNALPAAIAAHELNLPFYYEVRGFWELTKAAKDSAWAQSSDFGQEVAFESDVARAATFVFTINRFMVDELVRRGVDRARVQLVPNGFPGWPNAPESPAHLREHLGIKSSLIVGYIGSFNDYEGLSDLIEAVSLVRQHGVDVSLLLVGSSESRGLSLSEAPVCAATQSYRKLARQLGIDDFVFMPGRVAPELAEQFYGLLDVVVIPRRPVAVCEIVSPLKPLEAAAHGKRVLMSDVAPLADLAGMCPNFNYFKKGDVRSLVSELHKLLAIAKTPLPRCTALEDLTWDKNVEPIIAAVKALKPPMRHGPQ